MKKLFLVLALCAGLFAQTVIKVSSSATFPPFQYMENGEFVGFEVDLTQEIAKRLNLKVEWKPMNFDGIIAALTTGKLDLAVAGLSVTDERKKSVDFSLPYYDSTNLFIKKAGDESIKSIADLAGKRLGYQLGSVQEPAAKAVKGAIVSSYEENINLVYAMVSGKVDAIVIDNVIGFAHIKKQPKIEAFAEEKLEGSEGMAFALPKNSPYLKDFNRVMKELQSEGFIDSLYAKYGLK